MGTKKTSNRTALTVSLAIVGALFVLVIVAILNRTPPEPAVKLVKPMEIAKPAAPAPTPALPTPAPSPALEDVVEIIVTPVMETSAGPTPVSTMDPEDQPRKTHLLDFRELTSIPQGFVVDGLVLTEKGFQLPPPKPGEEDMPRFGTLASPAFPLDFPSNAVSPLWLEDIPEGSNIFLEVSVSPDGQNWGIWDPIEPDDDATEIAATFPDGRPNPNVGHKAGGVLFWGERQYLFYKFKATLSSDHKESPTLGTFHLFYQDSTLGTGHIAELKQDGIQK